MVVLFADGPGDVAGGNVAAGNVAAGNGDAGNGDAHHEAAGQGGSGPPPRARRAAPGGSDHDRRRPRRARRPTWATRFADRSGTGREVRFCGRDPIAVNPARSLSVVAGASGLGRYPAASMDRDPETGHGGAPARGAASVVVVVVTHDAGPELEPLLASLAGQDFDRLSVLVIDAASSVDPTPRVAAALPSAFVRRLDDNPGFGPAASLAAEMVEGASFLLFCHDDVALDQDAVRLLVDEAYRTNAGIVGPKLVEWDDPDHRLDVGIGADQIGRRVELVEPGEVDQEQHDAVRDVFVIPGACTLVRVALFNPLTPEHDSGGVGSEHCLVTRCSNWFDEQERGGW